MNYSIFEQMKEGTFFRESGETAQAYMERTFQILFDKQHETASGRINSMLSPMFCECSADEKTVTLEFSVQEWMRNPNGTLHGGLMATTMDTTLGLLARFYRQTNNVVTVQLSTNFFKAINNGERYKICAKAEKVGNRVIFLSCKAFLSASEETAAEATAIFM